MGIQYDSVNNQVVFSGDTYVKRYGAGSVQLGNATTGVVISDHALITAISAPATPSAGKGRLYTAGASGSEELYWLNSSGSAKNLSTPTPPSGDTRIIYNDTGAWAVSTIYQLKASGYTGIGQAAPGERLHLKDGSGNGAIVLGAHQNATAIAGTVEWTGTLLRWYDGSNWKNIGIDLTDPLLYKGVIDCSANPNYPAADAGHTYRISVAGKIGGASGPAVEISDMMICTVDSSASGDHATVGANWDIIQANLDGAVIGPASSTDHALARWNGATGKLVQNSNAILDDTGNLTLAGHLGIVGSAASYAALNIQETGNGDGTSYYAAQIYPTLNGNVTSYQALRVLAFTSGTPTVTSYYGANIYASMGSVTSTNTYGLYISGFTVGTNKWDVYAADATAKNYFAGYVGIGSDGPGFPLHVISSDGSTAFLRNVDSATTLGASAAVINLCNANSTPNNYNAIVSNDSSGTATGGLYMQITDHTNHYGKFYCVMRGTDGWYSRLVVDNDGRVGIGNNIAPSANTKLTFGTYYDIPGTNLASAIRFYESGTTVYGMGITSSTLNICANQPSVGRINFYAGTGNDAPSFRMTIHADGNVGIGTPVGTPPATLLTLGTAGTKAGAVSLAGLTSGVVTVNVAAAAGIWSLTLPTSGGTDGYVLKTNGSGVTSWVAATTLVTPAGSTDQVQFNSGSSTFGADSNLVWDNTNKRLGICTSPSAYKLFVVSSASYTARFDHADTGVAVGTAGSQFTLRNSSNTPDNFSTIIFYDAGDAVGGVYMQNVDQVNHYGRLCLVTRAADGWKTRLQIESDGKVGIGATPSATLDVQATSAWIRAYGSTNPYISAQDSTNDCVVKMQALDSAAYVGTQSNHEVRFIVNNAAKAYLTTTGRLGINVAAPSYILHTSVDGRGDVQFDSHSASDDGTFLWIRRSGGTQASPAAVPAGHRLGNICFAGFYDASNSSWGAVIQSMAYGLWSATNRGACLQFYTTTTGTTALTERMRIIDNGYVGIGATTPDAKLQVGTWIENNTVGNTPTVLFWGNVPHSTSSETVLRLHRPVASGVAYGGGADFNIYRYGAGSVAPYTQMDIALKSASSYVQTATVNVISMRDTGNVGIGNTTPDVLLTLGTAGTKAGAVSLAGATSGVVTVQVAAAAGTWSLTLPTTGGTNGYFLQTNGSGVATWAAQSTNATTVTVADETTDATCFPVFVTTATGDQALKTAASFALNSSTGQLTLGVTATKAGILALAGSTSGLVTVTTAAAAGTWTMTLPADAGTDGYFLKTNGSGVTSWAAAGSGGTPGGSNTNVQFNSSNTFGGDSKFYWDNTNKWLGIGDVTTASSILQISEQDVSCVLSNIVYADTITLAPIVKFERHRGTIASPTVCTQNTVIGAVDFYGRTSAGTPMKNVCRIECKANATYSGTEWRTDLNFYTSYNAEALPSSAMASFTTRRQFILNGGLVSATLGGSTVYPVISVASEGGTSSPNILLQTSNSYTATYGFLLHGGSGALFPTETHAGELFGSGSTGSYSHRKMASIAFYSEGTTSATAMPGRITFWTTPASSVTLSERMRITSAGYVYIGGTSAPTLGGSATTRKFIVSGDSASTGIGVEAAADQARLECYRTSGTLATKTAVASGDVLGALNFYGWDGGTTPSYIVASQVRGEVDGTVSEDIVSGRLTFYTRNTSGALAERMRLTGSGSLGIGTDAPSGLMEVFSSTTSDVYLRSVGDSAVSLLKICRAKAGPGAVQIDNVLGGITFMGYGASAYFTGGNIMSYAEEAWTNSSAPLYMTFSTTPSGSTSSVDRIRIDSAGKLFSYRMYSGYTIGGTNKAVYVDSTGMIGVLSSSLRTKQDVMDMEDIGWIDQLRPVNFCYRSTPGVKQYGLIAEEVDGVNKALVGYDWDGLPDSVSYDRLVPVLLKAVRELRHEMAQMKLAMLP